MYRSMALVITMTTALGFSPASMSAQESRSGFGVELDALPYITGGYYGSIWYGHDQWRIRGVVSKLSLPEFMVEDGFEDAETTAYAVILDRFFGKRAKRQEGPWVGAGLEFWRNRISREGFSQSAPFDSYVATVGAGYVVPIWRGLFVNPWLAGHYRFSGPDDVQVSDATYRPKAFLPEVSVKFGVRF